MNVSIAEARAALAQAALHRDPDLMLHAGALAIRTGLEADAVAPVRRLLTDHSSNGNLWVLLGLLHRKTDDLGAAVDALRRADQLQPKDPLTATYLAFASFEAGLPAAALFQRAQGLSPQDRSLTLGHSAALAAEARVAEAIKVLERALRREPRWLPGHTQLARLRWAEGERSGFAQSFERALEQMPGEFDLWREFIEAHVRAELYDDALALIARAKAAVGERPEFVASEAICRSHLGDRDVAERLFQSLLPTFDVGVTEHYVRHLFRQGRVGDGVAAAQAFMSRTPHNQLWPYLSVGWRLLNDPNWEWLEGDPGFIAVVDLADKLPPLDRLADCLRALHRSNGQPLDRSVRGGTQTDGPLFARIEPEIQQLKAAVVAAVTDYAARLPAPRPWHPLLIDQRSPVRFSGSWSVRLTGGGSHVDHFHPAGWISSALYVSLPDGMDHDGDESGWLVLGQARDLGVEVAPIRTVQPKPGRLVLFPSTMWHGTRRFEAGERLTVAFDVQYPQ